MEPSLKVELLADGEGNAGRQPSDSKRRIGNGHRVDFKSDIAGVFQGDGFRGRSISRMGAKAEAGRGDLQGGSGLFIGTGKGDIQRILEIGAANDESAAIGGGGGGSKDYRNGCGFSWSEQDGRRRRADAKDRAGDFHRVERDAICTNVADFKGLGIFLAHDHGAEIDDGWDHGDLSSGRGRGRAGIYTSTAREKRRGTDGAN